MSSGGGSRLTSLGLALPMRRAPMRDDTDPRAQDQQEKLVSDEHDFDAKKFGDKLRDQIHRDIHSNVKESMDPDQRRRSPIVVGVHLGGRGTSGLFWGAFLVLGGVALLL